MNTDGGPAFPVQALASPGSEVAWGMSLRDWFAGQETLADFDSQEASLPKWVAEALAGRKPDLSHVTKADNWIEHLKWEAEWRAALKYIRADAMLRARERGQEGANDDAWALHAAVTIHPAVGPESIRPTSWNARYWDGVRTLEESAPTIAAALRALRAKVEGGAQ